VSKAFPTVGIIGAGQLARLSVAPAAALGVKLILFAENSNDSGAQICEHVVGDYKNLSELKEFAVKCDVVTFEHALVPFSGIKGLEASGTRVYPTSAALEEMLKTNPTLLVKEHIDFDYEVAVMVARSPHSQATTWAPTQMIQEDGICTLTISPAPVLSDELCMEAQSLALRIAEQVGLIGVMAVEMFVKGSSLYINELSMGAHDSGHWTIEGSKTSQFEQHLRAVLDLPLGDTSLVGEYAVMGNILGAQKSDMYRPYLHLMARNPELKFHQYAKEVRPGRKIGHVNIVGKNLLELTEIVQHARDYMSGEIDE
jgi:5-(carboxyamino)imidazole ribonucleotide synthase